MSTPEEQATQKMEELAKKLEEMGKKIEEQAAAKAVLERKIEAQESQLLSDGYMEYLEKKQKGTSGVETQEESDPDTWTGKQLVTKLRSEHQETLKKATQAFEQKLEQMEKTLQRTSAYLDLVDAKVEKPRLKDLLKKDDMKAKLTKIAQDNPSWGAQRIFDHFETEEKLSIQAEQTKKEKEKKESLESELSAVGEKGGLPTSVTTGKKMSSKDAAEKAFELAMSGSEEKAEPEL